MEICLAGLPPGRALGITNCLGARVNCQTHGVCVISSNLPQSMQWLLTTEMNSCFCPWKQSKKTQKNNSRSRSEQKKKFKCTKFAVQTTEMSVRKGLDEGLWGGWKSLKFKQQTKTHMAPTLTQLTAPLTQNTVIIKLSTTESRQYHSAAS